MNYCENCGSEMNDGIDFCPVCGTAVAGGSKASGKGRKNRVLPIAVGLASLVIIVIICIFLEKYRNDSKIQEKNTEVQHISEVAVKNTSIDPTEYSSEVLDEVADNTGRKGTQKTVIRPDDKDSDMEEAYSVIKVGDRITLGTYEQDNNIEDGREDIEWEVLDVSGDSALIVSSYVLDCVKYNEEYEQTSWEKCTLRAWLNDDFYNMAFDEDEKSRIRTRRLYNADNPCFGTDGGEVTEDNVFCLGIDEIEKYYKYDYWEGDDYYSGYMSSLIVGATPYAVAQGAKIECMSEEKYDDYKEYNYPGDVVGLSGTDWWLRTPGAKKKSVVYVNCYGHTGAAFCNDVMRSGIGVRPTMWIDITDHSSIASGEETANMFNNLYEGGLVTFGHYEQDNNPDNGSEEIRWIVVAIENDKALLLSDKILDYARMYNFLITRNTKLNYSWQNSDLRTWLNRDFLNTAFTLDEQLHIVDSVIESDTRGYVLYQDEVNYEIKYETRTEWTVDRIFCLSQDEIDKYFEFDDQHYLKPKCEGLVTEPTEYTKTKCGLDEWWLRSVVDYTQDPDHVGTSNISNAIVSAKYMDGGYCGVETLRSNIWCGVRPAMWVYIDKPDE